MTDSDDLLVAYQHGAASMKDELEKVQAERDKLRHAMMKACDLIDDVAEGKTGMGTPYRVLAGALQEVVEEYDSQGWGPTLYSIDTHARPALRETEND
jgi:hypothetical protein